MTQPTATPPTATPQTERFDAGYYRRYYGTRPVHTRKQVGELAAGVVGLAGWWGLPLRSVLDIGAGPGYWRDWFAEQRPGVRYKSIDVSPYACERYGHALADISEWSPRTPADLVVCQGVLQYLDDRRAAAAISNLTVACRGMLFLEVPTQADRSGVLDTERSDLDVHFRSGRWYRSRLDHNFRSVGAGIHVARSVRVAFYELEFGGSAGSAGAAGRVAATSNVPPARQ